MIREFLRSAPLLDLPIVAMLLFLLLFLAVLLRVGCRARAETYRRMAMLPLDDGPPASCRDPAAGRCAPAPAPAIDGPRPEEDRHDHR